MDLTYISIRENWENKCCFPTFGMWHCSVSSLRIHLGGFSINSRQQVLSVNWMCAKSISSCRYWNTQTQFYSTTDSENIEADSNKKYSFLLILNFKIQPLSSRLSRGRFDILHFMKHSMFAIDCQSANKKQKHPQREMELQFCFQSASFCEEPAETKTMQLARLPVGAGCITLLKLCCAIKASPNFPPSLSG